MAERAIKGNVSSKKTSPSRNKPNKQNAANNYRTVRKTMNSEGSISGKAPSKTKVSSKINTLAKKTVWTRSGFDYPLFTIVIILLAFGLIMMFSASYAVAYTKTGDSLFYLKKQATFALIGLMAMIGAANVDYHFWSKKPIVWLLSIISMGLMVLVKVMGVTGNGAERWLQIGEITFQPSEVLKFAVIVLFAYMIEKNFDKIKLLKQGYISFMIPLGLSCGLLMLQPHLSGTIIVFAICFSMLFVGGARVKHLMVTIIILVPIAVAGIMVLQELGYDYFSARILSFMDPEADIEKQTFQTYQSLVTIGSGGVFGLGFGNSRQKYAYLPESQNDFIFPIICEELGFVGAALVILLFVILIWRGFYIASKARDKFGMLLAYGITFQMGLQALLNIAVVTNAVPNTGISLPFFSYGGTALMMQLGEMGILLNVSRKAALK